MKVIKIGAVWCNGCLVMRPRWQQIEDENPWLDTEYFDYDKDLDKLEKYYLDIKKLPTFIFLDKHSQELIRKNGEVSKEELLRIITENKDK